MFSMAESTAIAENTPILRSFLRLAKTSPIRAPFAMPISGKPRKTVRFEDVKNTLNYHPFCQNEEELRPIKCTPKAIESRRILPYILPRLL